MSLFKKKNILPTFKTSALETFNFGKLDGENEDLLKDFFIETNAIKKLTRGKYNYVLSPKGAGKSALFKALKNHYISNQDDFYYISINKAFDTTDNEYLSPKRFKSDLDRNKYIISWSLYLLSKLLSDIINNHKECGNYEKFISYISKYEDIKEEYELYGFLDNMVSLDLNIVYEAAGAKFSLNPKIGSNKKRKTIKLNTIYDEVNTFYKENNIKVRLLIDRVDNFVEREEYEAQKKYLQGLVYTVEELSCLSNVQPVLFLRTDLFYGHSIKIEYDKVRDRLIELKWTKDEILTLVSQRFLSIPALIEINRFYINHYKKQNEETSSNSIRRKIRKIIRNIQAITKVKPRKINLEKNLSYEFYELFLLQYFSNNITHINDKGKNELIGFCDWIFHHLEDANDYLNPRTIIRYLNLLAEKQYEIYRDHLDNFPQTIKSKITDSKFTCVIFLPDTIQCVFKDLQIEELKNIKKLLNTKNEQDIFLCINKLYSTKKKFTTKDINPKIYKLTPEDYDRLLKYLELLGYLKSVDGKTFCIKPLYNKSICTFDIKV